MAATEMQGNEDRRRLDDDTLAGDLLGQPAKCRRHIFAGVDILREAPELRWRRDPSTRRHLASKSTVCQDRGFCAGRNLPDWSGREEARL